MTHDDEWKEFVEDWGKENARVLAGRTPLTGDASNRRYFRVEFKEKTHPKTAILMERQGTLGFKKSEEAVSGGASEPPGDPFLLVADALGRRGLPVPSIYHRLPDGSKVLQEDLGDETVLSRLQSEAAAEEALTEKALALLVRLQTARPDGDLSWVRNRPYSRELIRWEFEHFVEYGLAGVPEGQRRKIREGFDREAADLAGEEIKVLVHRDYHSRNIMVRTDGSLALIDFQDLLWGSPYYDLASFLFDAYRTVPLEKIEKALARYLDLAQGAKVMPITARDAAMERLCRHAFQRNLKACGRFFYIADVKKNPAFLGSVAGTHANLLRIVGRVPSLAPLYESFFSYLRVPDSLSSP
ncbi:MAG: aminoglycoside phosphotransferase family protein [Leptospirillia bacterium]